VSGPHSLTLAASETPLTARAADFLASGPADAQALISYVCQLPGAPLHVAEHMAAALFAGHQKFARDVDGRWRLRGAIAETFPPIVATELHKQPFIVVDVEATGSGATRGDRVTEIAAVLVQNGTATTVFDTLINPERPIPPQITALTNITSSMVRNAPTFAEICGQLLGVLEGRVFVAHNAGFDWRFLSIEVERATGRRLEGVSLCTVRMLKRLVPNLRRRNLDAVAVHYGIEITARHRAGGDAVATAQVFLRLLKAARARGCTTLDDVQRLMAQRTGRRKRRRPPALPHSASDDSWA
jgi:DNA polymerase-3 subunit epsilon